MSNRALAFSFSFLAAILSTIAVEVHNLAMLGAVLFAVLQAIQYIALQICDAIEKSGKDAA